MNIKLKDGRIQPLWIKEKHVEYFQIYTTTRAGTENWIAESFFKDPTKEFYTNVQTKIIYSLNSLLEEGYYPVEYIN